MAMSLEPLEVRRALAVAAPSIRLMVTSDTGVKGDGITRLARPVFAGFAPPRAAVEVVGAGGHLLGVARANLKGVWSLATPVAKPMAAGEYIITATTVDPLRGERSSPTPLWIRIDSTPPVGNLAYDVINKTVTLSFTKPVVGVTLSSLRLAGTTTEVGAINVPLSDPGLASYIGRVSMQRSPDGRTYTFRHGIVLAEPGRYQISLIAQGSGITDLAGNPLARGVTTGFRII